MTPCHNPLSTSLCWNCERGSLSTSENTSAAYVDYMAQQTIADLRAYARRYILGKPHITGVLIAPEARQSLKLGPEDLMTVGTR